MKLEGDKGLAFGSVARFTPIWLWFCFDFHILGEAPSAMAAEGATKQAV